MSLDTLINTLGLKDTLYNGAWMNSRCPLHKTKDGRPFGINLNSGVYKCLSCDAVGHVSSLLKEKGLTKSQISKLLKDALKPVIVPRVPEFEYEVFQYFPCKLKTKFTKKFYGMFGNEVLTKFKIGYNPFSQSIVFPVYRKDNSYVGRLERPICRGDTDVQKYYKHGVLGSALYGEQFLKHQSSVIVVESPLDVLYFHQLGYPNKHCPAVGLMYTTITKYSAKTLSKYVDNVILFTDMDEAGMKAVSKLSKKIRCRIYYVSSKQKKRVNPRDFSLKEIVDLLKHKVAV